MIISGCVEDIIFKNIANGYTVLNIDNDGVLLTCVGKALDVNAGQEVELEGQFVKNNKFGEQFAFSSIKILQPKSLESIKKYLASGLIKGIGPVTAESIVNKFKEDTLNILEYAPNRLSEVRGISVKKAIEIGQCYTDIKKMQEAVIFLQSYDISTNLSVKIFNFYKDKTVELVSDNPYLLVEDIDGVGFLTADKIAAKMGIESCSNFRIRAGTIHVLKENSDKNGNTYILKDALKQGVANVLNLKEEEFFSIFGSELEKLEIESYVKTFNYKDQDCVALKKYYKMESRIASKINLLNVSKTEINVDVDDEIKEYERVNKIKLHEDQKEAIKKAVLSQVSIITGGPGTGKTTIVKCILSALKKYSKNIFLLAPTGRASKRLSEACSHKASTIHRALEVSFTEGESAFFNFNERNKLVADVVIVDEMSMVDVSLFYSLLKALPNTCKLILVGDKDQLPSVGAGNVLHDLIASKVCDCVKLSHIYRQDDKSLIVTNAHLINDGKMPDLSNKSTDFFYEGRLEPQSMYDCIVELVSSRLPKFLKCDPTEIQVLCAMKSGVCGVENLNKKLQEVLNPQSLKKIELNYETRLFREGDKVMQMVNNYDLEWRREDGLIEEFGKGVFNGDMGRIVSIDFQTGETEVKFEDDRICRYSRTEALELSVCYATTIHKSQGSEFDAVVIPVVAGSNQIITRNLLYTAVTRAKKLVVLVGPKKNIARMIYNNFTAKRFSMLEELLKLNKEKMENLYS
ncbi:MAG: ATP-dependent RecD-like DNA helicase [Clostridia bacterium]|nr:ATP-dependent RecD-like DNA helicase [Clostridia bacterium]